MYWWNDLTGLQQFFATLAIPATIVMIIQFILLMFGFSQGDGADADLADVDLDVDVDLDLDLDIDADVHVDLDLQDGFEGDSYDTPDIQDSDINPGETHESLDALRLFTLRGMIAFFSIGGWMGVAAVGWGFPTILVFVVSFAAGWLALYFVAWSIRAALRLQQSGNVIIENAVGKVGEVYIPIPASKKGAGKVSVIVQDRLSEFDAVTEEDRGLKTGEEIIVIGVESDGVLLVALRNNPTEGVLKF